MNLDPFSILGHKSVMITLSGEDLLILKDLESHFPIHTICLEDDGSHN
jgi:hypothetical protein